MSFNTLGFSAEVLRAVADQGCSKPTPAQHQAIPVILEGKEILAGAQTGTGKTADCQKLCEKRAERFVRSP